MARIKHQTKVINDQTGIDEWYPSSPARPGRYVIHAKSDESRISVIFAKTFAAKKFVEAVIGDEKPVWTKTTEITVEANNEARSEIHITSDLLEEIMEYDYTGEQEHWELPSPYSNYARQLRGGRYIERDETEASQKSPGGTERASKPEKRTAKPASKPRASRANLVTAIEMAAEFKLIPREFRGILRSLKLTKPEAGWAWPKDEADKIRKRIAKEIK